MKKHQFYRPMSPSADPGRCGKVISGVLDILARLVILDDGLA